MARLRRGERIRTLFAAASIETKAEEARQAILEAVLALPAERLADPDLPGRLARRWQPRPPRVNAGVSYRAYESEVTELDAMAHRRTDWGLLFELRAPFTGDPAYFDLFAGLAPGTEVEGAVHGRTLVLSQAALKLNARSIAARLERQLDCVRNELEQQARFCTDCLEDLRRAAERRIRERRERLACLGAVEATLAARGLKSAPAR